ncbi:MAG: UDP-N-acetylglucosamine 1-carboxyvinyltransferase [Acidobacteriota bacterium]|nr:UDP-N-acetylglucosamine 1-carboxyvinyltransferase [Acidobacteriota bacterium]MDQ7088166.1 UDP-N-acetylglucosamine 1-carboxyvinyltransferase [Acidobacteriota bacterium]
MDRLRIEGGRALSGSVRISGAKNAALPCLAASLLTGGEVRLDNVPDVWDVDSLIRLLGRLGTRCERLGRHRWALATEQIGTFEAPYELVRKMRASVLVLGPLLARHGRARVSLPGGCAIGARPIDRHLTGLERLGAEIRLEHGYVEAVCPRLTGARIHFDEVTVTGTENLMMAACLARGTTVLENAAREPEVVDLARLLTAMGARIEGAGSDTIEIEGVDALGGAEHRVVPDRIEAGTYLVAAAITGGRVTLEDVEPAHLEAVTSHLGEVGLRLEVGDGWIRIGNGRPLRARDMETQPYPGFPTDLQAQYMVLMSQAGGSSRIRETIFEQRFMHVPELRRMGASIELAGNLATVEGPTPLTGAEVTASDLRASACLVLAGLAARGETLVHRVYHLDRGYERIEEKLAALGARIERLSD